MEKEVYKLGLGLREIFTNKCKLRDSILSGISKLFLIAIKER